MNEQWQQYFARDASLFPHLFDVYTDRIMLSRLTEQGYKASSFLDQRILSKNTNGSWVQWEDLAFYTETSNPAPQFIFHLGHVGSTLISRLLGEIPSVLALREPQLLRDLAEINTTKNRLDSQWSAERYNIRVQQVLKWLSRRYRDDQTVMIKVSSIVSEIANDLLCNQSRTLFLMTSLDRYMETILAGEASLREMHMLAAPRLLRLQTRLDGFDVPLWKLSETQKIAVSWLCEYTALRRVADTTQANIMWLDFDVFLQSPTQYLVQTARFFGHELNENDANSIIQGPIMTSYSKAPEHKYSPDLRQQLLAQARKQHGASIDATVEWVEELAATYPMVANAMELTTEA